jgi:hypothetical protein
MKYVKPELVALAPAIAAVQGGTKSTSSVVDSQSDPRLHTIPAYEADE